MPTFRFPLLNPPVLEKWEKAVRSTNNCPEWKANHTSRICSNHFPQFEYIIPPTENGTCRLKTTSKMCERMESSCNLKPLTSFTSAEKVSHDHTYCKHFRHVDEVIGNMPNWLFSCGQNDFESPSKTCESSTRNGCRSRPLCLVHHNR